MRFAKLEGLANDYVAVLRADLRGSDASRRARALCDRRRGIGADGLLVIAPMHDATTLSMRIFNADGSEAEMCGNGLRCAARFAWERGLAPPDALLAVETKAGMRQAVAAGRLVRAEVGGARRPIALATVAGRRAALVDLGNPHCVVVVEDEPLATLDLAGLAREAERVAGRTLNVEAVVPAGRERVRQRTHERGVGETPACGTGAAAAALALAHLGLVDHRVQVELTGGTLLVETGLGHGGQEVWQTGEAVLVFEGEWRRGED